MVICMQNNVISIGITNLYGSHPSFGVFAHKTTTLEPELQLSMCLSRHLCFFAFKTAPLGPELQVSMGPRPHLCFFSIQNTAFSARFASLHGSQTSSVVFALKTATLGTELQVSIGPRPHLSFCACTTA